MRILELNGRTTMAIVMAMVVVLMSADASASEWQALSDHIHENVEVLEVGGSLTKGKLADVTDDFLLVAQNNVHGAHKVHKKVSRANVHRITAISPSTRKRNLLLGPLYGLGVIGGASVVYAWGAGSDVQWTRQGVLYVVVTGSTLGALVGLAASSPERRTILYEYENERP